jgi:hypothetical protein
LIANVGAQVPHQRVRLGNRPERQRARAGRGQLDLPGRAEQHQVGQRFFLRLPVAGQGGRERACQRPIGADHRLQPLGLLAVLALAFALHALHHRDADRQQHHRHHQ